MVQKYFKCEQCLAFQPIERGRRARKYCNRSCQFKAFYRRQHEEIRKRDAKLIGIKPV